MKTLLRLLTSAAPAPAHSCSVIIVLLVGLFSGVGATEVDAVIDAERTLQASERRAQARVDKLADEQEAMVSEYLGLVDEAADLERYNARLKSLVAEQQNRIDSFATRLAAAEDTRRDIVPLLERMLETLARFVAADIPFLITERNARLDMLRTTLNEPALAVAEKLRRILEAYQVEMAYGRTIEVYRGTIALDGSQQLVDLLRIGRVTLLYLSLDGASVGLWDTTQQAFRPIDARFAPPVSHAMRVARKEAPPTLLSIPMWGSAR